MAVRVLKPVPAPVLPGREMLHIPSRVFHMGSPAQVHLALSENLMSPTRSASRDGMAQRTRSPTHRQALSALPTSQLSVLQKSAISGRVRYKRPRPVSWPRRPPPHPRTRSRRLPLGEKSPPDSLRPLRPLCQASYRLLDVHVVSPVPVKGVSRAWPTPPGNPRAQRSCRSGPGPRRCWTGSVCMKQTSRSIFCWCCGITAAGRCPHHPYHLCLIAHPFEAALDQTRRGRAILDEEHAHAWGRQAPWLRLPSAL